MKVKNNKIVEATESELFDYYIKRGFDDLMPFDTYIESCKRNGTKIVEPKAQTTIGEIDFIANAWNNLDTEAKEEVIRVLMTQKSK